MSDARRDNPHKKASWFRYSLRTLLLLMLMVAVYLGGWASYRWQRSTPPLAGQWTASLPAGFKQPTSLQRLPDGQFLLKSRANNFNGIYQWKDERLIVVKPEDKRMKGLTWSWNGEELVLTAEPPDTPTGPSYLGTTLQKKPKSLATP